MWITVHTRTSIRMWLCPASPPHFHWRNEEILRGGVTYRKVCAFHAAFVHDVFTAGMRTCWKWWFVCLAVLLMPLFVVLCEASSARGNSWSTLRFYFHVTGTFHTADHLFLLTVVYLLYMFSRSLSWTYVGLSLWSIFHCINSKLLALHPNADEFGNCYGWRWDH